MARQEADCRALVDRLGWTVGDVYVDNDASAYSGRARPEYQRMLQAVRDGHVEAIVAWHPDRLQRSPRELEAFIDVVTASQALVATVQAGVLDLSSPSGRMTARLVGTVARHESEHKSERHRRKALELAEAGKVGGGGTRPFGFESDRVTLRPGEAAVVREAARRIRSGDTMRSVVTWLAVEGVTSPTGGPWSTTSFRRTLLSPRVAGLREHRGELVGEAVWPAIVDRVTWEGVRRVLTDPGRATNRGAPPRYLLTGLAWCGLCGTRLVARPKADGRRCVVCVSGVNFGGCGKIRQLVGPLDIMVVDAVGQWLDGPTFRARVADRVDPDLSGVTAEIAGSEQRLRDLAADYADGTVDRLSWSTARQRIVARLEALRAQMPSATPSAQWAGRGVELGAGWDAMHVDQQRAVVADVVERIVIGPAVAGRNTFQPERVRILWR